MSNNTVSIATQILAAKSAKKVDELVSEANAEIQPEVMENPTTTLDSKPSERIENAGSGVGSAEGQREMDQPSGTRYLPAQLQSTAPEVAQPKPVTNEQVQSKVEELLRAPTPVTRKPAVAFKTQTEESAFRRGFEAATKKQGEMPPPERAGLSPKDRKWDDAWRKGWASGQTFVRALPTQVLEPATQILAAKSAKKVDELVSEANGYQYISQKTLNRVARNAGRRLKELKA